MNKLYIDIETFPTESRHWGLWQQNIGINQIQKPGGLLCLAWAWAGSKKTYFARGDEMYDAAFEILDAADVLVHFNGKTFDTKHLNTEFAIRKMGRPAPFRELDLLAVVKKHFRFPSNKLEYVSKALGLKGKVQTGGFQLWNDCMAGDAKAWLQMEKYNRQDVALLPELEQELLPWIGTNAPNANLFGGNGCPTCGSASLQKRGLRHTTTGAYQRYQCNDCGSWSTDGKRIDGTQMRGM